MRIYERPQLRISSFSRENILTASGNQQSSKDGITQARVHLENANALSVDELIINWD